MSFGGYLAGVAGLVAIALPLGLASVRLRGRLLPGWDGAPARLVEAVLGLSLLTIMLQLLGAVGLFYAWALIAASIAIGAGVALRIPRGEGDPATSPPRGSPGFRRPPSRGCR